MCDEGYEALLAVQFIGAELVRSHFSILRHSGEGKWVWHREGVHLNMAKVKGQAQERNRAARASTCYLRPQLEVREAPDRRAPPVSERRGVLRVGCLLSLNAGREGSYCW